MAPLRGLIKITLGAIAPIERGRLWYDCWDEKDSDLYDDSEDDSLLITQELSQQGPPFFAEKELAPTECNSSLSNNTFLFTNVGGVVLFFQQYWSLRKLRQSLAMRRQCQSVFSKAKCTGIELIVEQEKKVAIFLEILDLYRKRRESCTTVFSNTYRLQGSFGYTYYNESLTQLRKDLFSCCGQEYMNLALERIFMIFCYCEKWPNELVQFLHWIENPPKYSLIEEFVGENLIDLYDLQPLAKKGQKQNINSGITQISFDELLNFMRQILSAIALLAKLGIVNFSLAPKNIRGLKKDGQPCVYRIYDYEATRTGGAEAWKSPEEIAQKQVTSKSMSFWLALIIVALIKKVQVLYELNYPISREEHQSCFIEKSPCITQEVPVSVVYKLTAQGRKQQHLSHLFSCLSVELLEQARDYLESLGMKKFYYVGFPWDEKKDWISMDPKKLGKSKSHEKPSSEVSVLEKKMRAMNIDSASSAPTFSPKLIKLQKLVERMLAISPNTRISSALALQAFEEKFC